MDDLGVTLAWSAVQMHARSGTGGRFARPGVAAQPGRRGRGSRQSGSRSAWRSQPRL